MAVWDPGVRAVLLTSIAPAPDPSNNKMDLFADALADSSGMYGEVDAPATLATLAPSQDIAAAEKLTEEGLAAVITIDCITEEGLSTDVGDDVQCIEPVLPPATTRSRKTCTGTLAKASKRKYSKTKVLTTMRVEPADAIDVPCVFLEPENGKVRVPIPLWNQYHASWGTRLAGNERWIAVGPQEHWLLRLVDSQTKKPVRQVLKAFTDSFRMEFTSRVKKARTFQQDANALADDDDDETDDNKGKNCRC